MSPQGSAVRGGLEGRYRNSAAAEQRESLVLEAVRDTDRIVTGLSVAE